MDYGFAAETLRRLPRTTRSYERWTLSIDVLDHGSAAQISYRGHADDVDRQIAYAKWMPDGSFSYWSILSSAPYLLGTTLKTALGDMSK